MSWHNKPELKAVLNVQQDDVSNKGIAKQSENIKQIGANFWLQ